MLDLCERDVWILQEEDAGYLGCWTDFSGCYVLNLWLCPNVDSTILPAQLCCCCFLYWQPTLVTKPRLALTHGHINPLVLSCPVEKLYSPGAVHLTSSSSLSWTLFSINLLNWVRLKGTVAHHYSKKKCFYVCCFWLWKYERTVFDTDMLK